MAAPPTEETPAAKREREDGEEDGKVWAKRPRFEYYTEKYYVNLPRAAGAGGGEQLTAWHCNGLAIECIAEGHPIATGAVKVQEVTFANERKKKGSNRMDLVNPQGKKKKGSMYVNAETVICTVTLEDGTKFKVHANTAGHLIELNARLLTTPDLLRSSPTDQGWIGVIQPSKDALAKLKALSEKNGLATKNLRIQ